MNHQTRSRPVRIGVLLLALLLLVSLSPLVGTAKAAGDGWKENIVLTGNFQGIFTLDSNTSEIFRVDNAAPGDSWRGSITIENRAGTPMEVALLSIVSELEDLDLYNALTLDIHVGQFQVYTGSYGATPIPVSPYFVVASGASIVMDVTVGLPATVGNEMMGKEMDSTWTFEARLLDGGPGQVLYPYIVKYIEKDSGAALAPDKVGYAPLGALVTEYALPIPGYLADAAHKSIIIQPGNNLIVFYYDKLAEDPDPAGPDRPSDPDQPSGPSDPDDDPSGDHPGNVQTGTDLSTGNTTTIIYILAAALCLLAILLIFLRIRAIKRQDDTEE